MTNRYALFFTVIIVTLAGTLPAALEQGLASAGLPSEQAAQVAKLPPTAALFAAFLGYNPMAHMLAPDILASLSPAVKGHLLSAHFFPQLVAGPLMHGLREAFYIAATMSLVAAITSLFRGNQICGRPLEELGAERAPLSAHQAEQREAAE